METIKSEASVALGIETKIVLSSEISAFLNSVLKVGIISRPLKTKIRIALSVEDKEKSIPYDVLTEAHEFYSEFKRPKEESEFIDLHDLVKSSRVFVETIPEPVRSPELTKRLKRLQFDQENREYNEMVKNVKSKKMTLGQEVGELVRTTGQQSMSILNFLLSVGATFAFGFVSSQYAFSEDLGLRIIFAIVLATIVALAELYFMARVEI